MLTKQADMKRIQLLSKERNMTTQKTIDGFLESISLLNRVILMRRYWFCDTYADIAACFGISERKVKRLLRDTREQMCLYLDRPWGSFRINQVDFQFIHEAETAAFPYVNGYQHHCLSFVVDFPRFIMSRLLSPEHVKWHHIAQK